jgi:hypothetical protein
MHMDTIFEMFMDNEVTTRQVASPEPSSAAFGAAVRCLASRGWGVAGRGFWCSGPRLLKLQLFWRLLPPPCCAASLRRIVG